MVEIKNYISDNDIYLYNIGEAQKAYELFGCHFIEEINMHRFAVWAPNAISISVVGDFNSWDFSKNIMSKYKNGVFVAFIPDLEEGMNYKYLVHGYDGSRILKTDPFAFHCEVRPHTASKVWNIDGFEWTDKKYMQKRIKQDVFKMPISIYEMHIGSWKTKEGYDFANFREVADELSEYLLEMNYTHVEVMPIAEHPFDGSWGYQVTCFYAITSRYGTPQDFMYFVDKMHSVGIGVILDWVPAHFPKDEHGLARFDGTRLYEHENILQREHPQWGTLIFNYSRPEVVSFLVSNAMYYFEKYHIDGMRVDAVTSMLYLDYARDGYFVPNEDGGNIDKHAVDFLRKVNSVILTCFSGTMMIAEESTSYPMLTKPPYDGGLGFTFKWNMGFMHDTLKYMSMDHYFRQFEHNKMTFSMYYAFTENFILPYSHDEVVHGKLSMVNKMYGDYWQKFASLRVLYGYMFAHPGKKLMFMGDEFAQFIEWDFNKQLDWFLLDYESHKGMQDYVKKLNGLYKKTKAFYEVDDSWDGFKWLNVEDNQISVLAFLRMAQDGSIIVCITSFTQIIRENYLVAMPFEGSLKLMLNSDDEEYGGSGYPAKKTVKITDFAVAGMAYSASVNIPPLAALYYKYVPTKNSEVTDL